MGESKRKRAAGLIRAGEKDDTALAIDKLGGRMHVRWDAQAAATPCVFQPIVDGISG